jgi:preprotein translocase subunit YajC
MPYLIAQTDGGSGSAFLLTWVLILGGFFLFVTMRQRNRMRKRQDFLGSLGVGDRVRTIGGIIGVIDWMDEDEIVLGVEGGVKLRFIRGAIAEKTSAEVP